VTQTHSPDGATVAGLPWMWISMDIGPNPWMYACVDIKLRPYCGYIYVYVISIFN